MSVARSQSRITTTDPVACWFDNIRRLMESSYGTFLGRPIQLIQTHISVVLLGERYVLKFKKPVDMGFLDFTTIEKRRDACQAEVDLNSRLCPDVYLTTLPVRESDGQFSVTGDGEISDYAVLMKRLPTEFMLDQLVARDEVTELMMDRIAHRLSGFHARAAAGATVTKYGTPEIIRSNWEENFSQTARYVGRTISGDTYQKIRLRTDLCFNSLEPLMRERAAAGRIRDGHGDVRCESICVEDGISIFDCIEFNKRFRCGDVASEVAFLGVDLHAHGRPDLAYYFATRYEQLAFDEKLFDLLPFYRCYRAFVRGKVLSFRLDEAEFNEVEKARAETRAKAYFQMARRYATPLTSPTVIAIMGLSGTGKTALARAIAEELGIRVVSSDEVRKAIFRSDRREYEYGEGPYSAEATRRTYQELISKGHQYLSRHGAVVLDATFKDPREREEASAMARAAGAEFRSIECHAPDQVVKERLRRRQARKEGLSDATWQTYVRQREEVDPRCSGTSTSHLVLDVTGSLRLVSYKASDWLRDLCGADSRRLQ